MIYFISQKEVLFLRGTDMKIRAYAKINLILDITGVLENGYHSLYSVMQSVSLYDEINVTRNDSGKITIICREEGVPEDERNIAYKAAVRFFDYCKINDRGISVEIKKNIPHAAGLAGGSADGAAVIKALCSLYNKDLGYPELVKIAKKIGADVPFCLFGGTALAQNIGDVLSFLPDMPDCYIVISKPCEQVKTEGAYAAYDEMEGKIRHLDKNGMLQAVLSENLDKIADKCSNVFEQFVEVCDRAYIKSVMRESGAKAACMSGSGPSVFGIFDSLCSAQCAYEKLMKLSKGTFICKPVKTGCEITEE